MVAAALVLGSDASAASAQQAAVQGIVTDSASAQPLAGAEVVLERAGRQVRSVLTDGNGLFQIGGLAAGAYRLRISSFGYGPHEEPIELEGGERLLANRRLVPAPLRLEGVGIVDRGRGAVRRQLGGQMITAGEMRRIPSPASGDMVGYLQTMPGVVGTGDRGGQLFIRGGTPSENMVLMDGMLIYQPFHVTGFSSVFPADLVNSAEFFPGGFGPEYSGRVSSVLDVRMRDGNRSEAALSASVSPFVAEVLTEGPLLYRAGGGSSYIFSGRRSLIEETSPWLLGEEQPLGFDSYYLKLSSFGGDGVSRCSLTSLRSSDRGGLDPEDEESRVGWTNFAVGGRCSSLGSGTFLDARFSYSRLGSEAITRGASEFSSVANRISMNGDASRSIGRVRLGFGGFLVFKHASHDFLEFLSQEARGSTWAEAGAYAEADIPLGASVRLLPGATLTWAPRTSASALEPRLRAAWRPGALTDAELSGSVGLYSQRIVGISDRRDASSVFAAWMGPEGGSRVEALHAQMSWQQSLGGLSWSVDGYYRRMANLPVATWTPVATFTTELSLADGRSRGADGRVELRRGRFYAFAGYGWGRTEYESRQEDFGVWFGEPVQSYHPSHDRRHQVNALASLDLGRYTFAARWELGSGFPFTRIIGFDEVFDFRTGLPNVKRYGDTRVLLDRPFRGRLPATHRLDVSAERLFDIGSRQVLVQAGVINVYDRTNIFYYDIFTTRRVDQLPFAPYLSLRLQPPASTGR